MPAFIRTPKDEARWSRAKKAVKESRKKGEDSFEDQDWALVNSIYHKMHKSELAHDLLNILSKAHDDDEDEAYLTGDEPEEYGDEDSNEEEPDYDVQNYGDDEDGEEDLGSMGIHEFDPDQEGGDDADAWLASHDPKRQETKVKSPQEEVKPQKQERKTSASGYSDWQPRSDYSQKEQAAIKQLTDQGYSPREAEYMADAHKGPTNIMDALRHPVRPSQMSPKMHAELKDLASHYLQNLSRHSQINADPEKNPMKHAAGRMLEAHEGATKDYSGAYNQFLNSDDVKNLKGMDRVRAINNWKKDWKAKNPEYTEGLAEVGKQAKEHHSAAQERHKMGVDERLKHIMTGGVSMPGETYSAQEAAQHVGGEKTDEGGYKATTIQDPSASFATQNKVALDKLKSLKLKPEHADKLKHIDSVRASLNVAPKVIRRPGGQT